MVGAFLGGFARWPIEADGTFWISIGALSVGLGLVVAGYIAQRATRLQDRAGIVVSILDPHGGSEGRDLVERAMTFSTERCRNTFTVAAELTGNRMDDRLLVEEVLARTSDAIRLANRLVPGAENTLLIPITRLHVAFWLGAYLGNNPVRPLALYAPAGGGSESYFLAADIARMHAPRPRKSKMPSELLEVSGPERLDGDPTHVALAIDVLHLGDDFLVPVREECRRSGIGWLLHLSSAMPFLPPTTETWTGLIQQVEREWRMRRPEATREGRYAVFTTTTAAVAVALGARLAAVQPGRWTAYTLERSGSGNFYEAFPPEPRTTETAHRAE